MYVLVTRHQEHTGPALRADSRVHMPRRGQVFSAIVREINFVDVIVSVAGRPVATGGRLVCEHRDDTETVQLVLWERYSLVRPDLVQPDGWKRSRREWYFRTARARAMLANAIRTLQAAAVNQQVQALGRDLTQQSSPENLPRTVSGRLSLEW